MSLCIPQNAAIAFVPPKKLWHVEEVGKAGSPCTGSLAYRPDRDLADLSNSTPSRHVTNIDGDVNAKLDALGIENEPSTANSVLQLLLFLSPGERRSFHLINIDAASLSQHSPPCRALCSTTRTVTLL